MRQDILARVNKIVCSTGSTNAPFIFREIFYTYPKIENNYHLVLSTGNIN
jgi:hypothetical protein